MMTIMSWTQRIIEATGARPENRKIDWAPVEAALGTPLPADYRELCESFPGARYSGYLWLHEPTESPFPEGLLYSWRWHLRHPQHTHLYEPYPLYGGPGRPGLLRWGNDQTEGEYYWLADATADPASWPLVARRDGIEPWHEYRIGMSELIHRMLTDHDFTPFTVAHTTTTPFILPETEDITTAEQWNARAHGTGDGPAA